MAFGQASGPPAGGRQIDELAGLFQRAGYGSFKEARHPFGLTQRQAGGKFTAGEADELIERLQAAEVVQQSDGPAADATGAEDVPIAPTRTASAVGDASPNRGGRRTAASLEAQRRREERRAETLQGLAEADLVAELERRGWCCIPPLSDEATET